MTNCSAQSGILVQLLSGSYCTDCKVQEIWDSTCVISDYEMKGNNLCQKLLSCISNLIP